MNNQDYKVIEKYTGVRLILTSSNKLEVQFLEESGTLWTSRNVNEADKLRMYESVLLNVTKSDYVGVMVP